MADKILSDDVLDALREAGISTEHLDEALARSGRLDETAAEARGVKADVQNAVSAVLKACTDDHERISLGKQMLAFLVLLLRVARHNPAAISELDDVDKLMLAASGAPRPASLTSASAPAATSASTGTVVEGIMSELATLLEFDDSTAFATELKRVLTNIVAQNAAKNGRAIMALLGFIASARPNTNERLQEAGHLREHALVQTLTDTVQELTDRLDVLRTIEGPYKALTPAQRSTRDPQILAAINGTTASPDAALQRQLDAANAALQDIAVHLVKRDLAERSTGMRRGADVTVHDAHWDELDEATRRMIQALRRARP